MRVVLDSNILLSSLLKRDTPPDHIRRAWDAGRFTLVSHEGQIGELRRISRYPHLARYLKPYEVGGLIGQIRRHALMPTDLPRLNLSSDPNDNLILAVAVAGEATTLLQATKTTCLRSAVFRVSPS